MIYAYHRPCGASKLAKRLRLSILYREGGGVRRRDLRPHINWGWVGLDISQHYDRCLNHNIRDAVSKVKTFELLKAAELPVPRWSKTSEELMKLKPKAIIARRDGLSGGRDMTLWRYGEPEPKMEHRVDFYVERLSCHREFRIHVFRGEAILRQAKFVPRGYEGIAKNHENGCFFTSKELDRFATEAQLRDLEQLSVKAVEALGLDFAAVDILLTKKMQPYILELNTAPGLRTDATYAAYEGALRKLYKL